MVTFSGSAGARIHQRLSAVSVKKTAVDRPMAQTFVLTGPIPDAVEVPLGEDFPVMYYSLGRVRFDANCEAAGSRAFSKARLLSAPKNRRESFVFLKYPEMKAKNPIRRRKRSKCEYHITTNSFN